MNELTKQEKELINNGLDLYLTAASKLIGYDELMELRKSIISITDKLELD